MVRDRAPNPSYTWTPEAGDVGNHQVLVWVRNAGSASRGDAPPMTIVPVR